METNNQSKLSNLAAYIIFGLGALLVVSIIFNIYLYYKSRIRLFDCNLGENIEIDFFEQSDTLLGNIVYPSNLVGGTKYNQNVIIKSQDLALPYYVRAKVIYADYNITDENININIVPTEAWIKGKDDYYYLQAYLEDYSNITFLTSLTLPTLTTEVKNNTIISIIFQFLDTNKDISTIWAPPDNWSVTT